MHYRSVFRPGLFDGKVVIVTGGGSGLGRCTAHELASLGAAVALVGRTESKLRAVQAETLECNPDTRTSITTHVCDIRLEDVVRSTVADIIAHHGRIDGLFNNAGGQFPTALRDLSLKGWDAVVRNNLGGTFVFSREVYTQWMESHGGAIVNMLADIWGGMPGMGHTGAARAGTLNFTETAACEWASAGVRVNAVAPGWVASSGFDTYAPEFRDNLKAFRHRVPLQRHGTESEVSAAVVFLLCEASSFITGVALRVDGGVPNARPTWPLTPHHKSEPYNGFPLYQRPSFLDED